MWTLTGGHMLWFILPFYREESGAPRGAAFSVYGIVSSTKRPHPIFPAQDFRAGPLLSVSRRFVCLATEGQQPLPPPLPPPFGGFGLPLPICHHLSFSCGCSECPSLVWWYGCLIQA